MRKFLAIACMLAFIAGQVKADDGHQYAGVEACADCHRLQVEQWQKSHHALAMQPADNHTVLADFSGISFANDGITSTFFKKAGRFMVNTEDETGRLKDFEIAWTFGIYPLQQYMVKFPGGRIQVLDIAWDSRTKAEGGQHWFSLHPQETISADDVLHWTGPNMNWNYMCADCHSTGLKKNYHAEDNSYDTQWDAINVSCEACHGPAAAHIQWAKTGKSDSRKKGLRIQFPDSASRLWQLNNSTGKPYLKTARASNHVEIELCAKCHSRRSQFSDDFVPGDSIRDHYLPALLTNDLYYPDGKIKDEVYVYGSFKQSKMYHAGVTCSDCHNVHTLELKASGDRVCDQCHVRDRYATDKHHFHKAGPAAPGCVDCHMPAKTYMVVDERNDHSFRIPRPDLQQALPDDDLPDACTSCHRGKNSAWAADALSRWYGKTPTGYQQFAPALHAAGQQQEDVLKEIYNTLLSDAPAIAKASLIGYLGDYPGTQTLLTSMQMIRSADPDIRRSALQSLEKFPVQHTLPTIFAALEDKVRSVRMEAARILLPLQQGELEKEQRLLLDKVTDEYRQSLMFTAERPETQLALAQLHQSRGEMKLAEKALQEALRLEDQYVPAYVNYADFLHQQGRDKAAYDKLLLGMRITGAAAIDHALGLWYVRNGDKNRAIDYLRQAAEKDEDNPRYQYVYAVAVADSNTAQAVRILLVNLEKHSGHLDSLAALTAYYKQLGETDKAMQYSEKLEAVLRHQ